MAGVLKQLWSIRVMLIMFLTPILLLPLPLHIGTQEAKAAFVLITMSVYWITEVVPIYTTALMPIFMFPMLGVVKAKVIAPAYISETIMVFIGGLIMAVAIETWDIHKRMALKVLLMVGSQPRWLMLGLMLSTWFISMWISNSATTAMMIPIAQAIILQLKGTNKAMNKNDQKSDTNDGAVDNAIQKDKENEIQRPVDGETGDVEEDDDDDDPHYKRTCKAISLCIAYAANAGGIGSLTGTGPNLVVKDHADTIFALYKEENTITYTSWMSFGMPLSFILMIISWGWLQLMFLRCRGACDCCSSDPEWKARGDRVKKLIREHYDALGPVTWAQGSVFVMFCIMVLCWISRDLGGVGGWSSLFEEGYVKDSTSAMLIAVLMFVLPSKVPPIFCKANKYMVEENVERPRALLVWQDVHEKLPWGLFLLLGGGFALARGCQDSGLSQWIGDQLTVFKGLNPWLTLIILCYISSFCTEVISNVATATIIMPIISSLAISTGVNPLFYMIPTSIATSFAYMLPVATAPNALVFAYGHLRIMDMVSAGFILNVIAVPLLIFATYAWGNPIFNLDVVPPGFLTNATIGLNGTSA